MDINIQQLAGQLVVTLGPVMPYLLEASKEAGRAGAEKVGEVAWSAAQGLWNRLWPAIKARPAAEEVARDAAKASDDPDALEALRLQIRKLLEQDPALARELAASIRTVTASGKRSVAIGGNANCATIITGSGNGIGTSTKDAAEKTP